MIVLQLPLISMVLYVKLIWFCEISCAYNGMDRSCEATIYPMLDKPRTAGAFQDRRKIEPLLRPA
jgi:hypothetical protein